MFISMTMAEKIVIVMPVQRPTECCRKCMESSVGATHKFTSGSDVSKIVGKRRYLRNALGDSQPEGLRKASKLCAQL